MLDIEDGFIDLADARLEYRWIRSGSSAETTLVFLHEGLGSISTWGDFPRKLVAQSGCNGFLYSRESYGRSSPLSSPRQADYHYHEANKVLAQMLDAMGIEHPLIIGHSDGATIGIIYAAAGEKPVAQGLVLMAPHVFVEDVTVEGVRLAGLAFERAGLREKLAPHHDDVDGAFRGWHEIWLDPESRDWNIEAVLPGINCPSLLLQGVNDQYGTAAQLDAIEKQSSGKAESHLLDDCGHVPFREQEEACLGIIGRFIDGVRS